MPSDDSGASDQLPVQDEADEVVSVAGSDKNDDDDDFSIGSEEEAAIARVERQRDEFARPLSCHSAEALGVGPARAAPASPEETAKVRARPVRCA